MRRHCEDQGAHYCEALARIPNMDSWLPLGMPLSIAAAGLASAAHASAWPTSQRWGPSYHRLRTDASDIALTFDDGPSNETMRFLDVLDGLGVPATFFVCGRNVERQPKTARAIVEAGHALGNHTFSHPCLPCPEAGVYRFDLVQRQIARTLTGSILCSVRSDAGLHRGGHGLPRDDLPASLRAARDRPKARAS